MASKETALEFIRQAEEKAERNFQAWKGRKEAVLAIAPKGLAEDKLKAWWLEAEEKLRANRFPFLDSPDPSREELTGKVRFVLSDIEQGRDSASLSHYAHQLAQRMEYTKVMAWVQSLLEGDASQPPAGQREERQALAWELAQGIVKEWPGTGLFGDEASVYREHFPKLEELAEGWERLKADFPKVQFEGKLKAQFEGLQAEIEAKGEQYNPEEAAPFPGALNLPKDWHKERQPERLDYLSTLFFNTLAVRYGSALFLEGSTGKAQPTGQQGKPTTKVWALYYWYLQEAGLFDGLLSDGSKMKTAGDIAQKHGISYQNFYQTFNAIGRKAHEKDPKRNPDNIRQVIALLQDYPQAQQLAIDELKKIE